MLEEIKEDLKRAEDAFASAERNLKEEDIYTAANRVFVACENAVYVLLKSKFGSASISRLRILTRLKEVSPKAKEAYDLSYDLKVQSDYGRKSQNLPLNRENLIKALEKVRETVKEAKDLVEGESKKE